MSAVPSAPASMRNTWTCPTCKHGSPDPRDQAAHLDAHRQLGRFLADWDAAVVSDRKKEQRRRPTALLLAGLVGLATVVAGLTYWRFDHSARSSQPVASPVVPDPAPVVPAPVPPPTPALTVPAPEAPGPAPRAPEASATPPTPTEPVPGPLRQPSPRAPAATAPAAPSGAPAVAGTTAVPAPASPARSGVASLQTGRSVGVVAPPAYLLQLCLFNACLTIP